MRGRLSLILALLLASTYCLRAQDDVQKAAYEAAAALVEAPKAEVKPEKPRYWTFANTFDLGLSQTCLINWAAGGYNSASINAGIDAKANYAKNLRSWNTRLQLQYGFLWSADKKNLLQKSNDLIYLESRFAYKTGENSKWNYTASLDFRSQFTKSYDSYSKDQDTGRWEGKLKSGFVAPAYTNIAFGMEWVPAAWINLNIAPITGGLTICGIDELRQKYGMKLRHKDADPSIGGNYRSVHTQLGTQVKLNIKASVNDVFTYEMQAVFFTDYFDHAFTHNRINWDNKLTWQIARFFRIGVSTWLIYDPNVKIDGKEQIQFKEFSSINFTYQIASKKK